MTSSGSVKRSRVPRSGEFASAVVARAVRSSGAVTVVMAATYPVARSRWQRASHAGLGSETVPAPRPVARPAAYALYADPVSITSTTPRATGATTGPATAPRIGVLAVQGDVREHLAALTALGAEAVLVRRPAEVEGIDGLVIPGGESTVMDKLVRAFDLREPLLRRIAEGMPVYGSCAGMIMLADRIADARPDQQTLGGLDITVRRNAFGRQVDSFEQDLHIRAIGGAPMRAVFIRAPWGEEVGEGVEV